MVAVPKDKFPIGCKVRVISEDGRWKTGDIGKVIGYGGTDYCYIQSTYRRS